MVDHKLLLSKLEAKKLDRTLVQWFQCYLTDRTQFLTLKGQSSSCRATYIYTAVHYICYKAVRTVC